jgi:hypothetical protein
MEAEVLKHSFPVEFIDHFEHLNGLIKIFWSNLGGEETDSKFFFGLEKLIKSFAPKKYSLILVSILSTKKNRHTILSPQSD